MSAVTEKMWGAAIDVACRPKYTILDILEAAEAVREPDLLPGLRRALELRHQDWTAASDILREIARLEQSK